MRSLAKFGLLLVTITLTHVAYASIKLEGGFMVHRDEDCVIKGDMNLAEPTAFSCGGIDLHIAPGATIKNNGYPLYIDADAIITGSGRPSSVAPNIELSPMPPQGDPFADRRLVRINARVLHGAINYKLESVASDDDLTASVEVKLVACSEDGVQHPDKNLSIHADCMPQSVARK